MNARRLFFYTPCNVAGTIICGMSVTGVLLAYERQMTPRVDLDGRRVVLVVAEGT